ncbi:MAG: hypothetical protein A2X01_14075 [Bacteroidetes bacterium GWF2_35_48]|nr:MAG: hypothetical protein A2X01_14075 [Bacteroidetes bacterium GWF2_35_48]
MKKFILIFFALFICKAYSQTWVTIPDTNFVNYLQSNIPQAMNGNQMDISSPWVTSYMDTIYLGTGNITDLTGIQYFTSLRLLNCNYNDLTWLPSLPNSIKILACGMNQLTSLPELPDSLISLYCIQNNLTSLPPLPNTITVLYCNQNNLTSLPALPYSLKWLLCYDNLLTELPTFSGLTHLECQNNLLTSLPALNSSLTYLNCNNNFIAELPPLPQLDRLYCSTNNISCFPEFPSSIWSGYYDSHHVMVYSLYIWGNPFDCMPNHLPGIMSPDLLSYPLCAEGNANGCSVVSDIEENRTSSQNLFELTMVQNKAVIQASAAANLILYNTMGSVQLSSTINKGKQEIDFSNLTSGMYIVTIISNEKIYCEKIVIEH